jgi:hypothetical protein
VPQNHRDGFLVWASKPSRLWFVGCATKPRSSGLLGVEASLARVSQSGLKIGRGTTMGGARDTNVEVASEVS